MDVKIRSTTILGVRKKGQIAIGGDGQVTFGDMAFKQKAIKVREFDSEKGIILGGFAGAAADALTLFEKFESKIDEVSYEKNSSSGSLYYVILLQHVFQSRRCA